MASFQEDSEAFLTWLQNQEGARISRKVSLADLRDSGAGRGVVATEDIESGEELFFIPRHAVMSVYTSDLSAKVPEVKKLKPWVAIVLTMIFEHGQGPSGRFWSYFNVLPDEFNTLLYWKDKELGELEGSAVLDKLGHLDVMRMIDHEISPFIQKYSSLFGIHAVKFCGPRPDGYLTPLVWRMGTLVMAYAFDIERPEREEAEGADDNGFVEVDMDGPKGMVPLADMLNADGDVKNNARLEQDENGLQMIAIKHIPKGAECFNDYGACPRSDLLRRYGYITDEYAPNDVVELSLEHLKKATAAYCGISTSEMSERCDYHASELGSSLSDALALLPEGEECQFLDDTYDLPSFLDSQHFFDPGLISTVIYLRALAMRDEGALDEAKLLRRIPLDPPDYLKQLLCAVLKSRLDDYPTTIAEDIELFRKKNVPLRRRQAIQVRLGEKEILSRAAHSLVDSNRETDGDDRIAKRIKT